MKRIAFARKSSDAARKKCKVCRSEFESSRPAQIVCGLPNDCAAVYAAQKRAKVLRVEAKREEAARRQSIENLQPRKWHLANLKRALHLYIRTRDEGKQCISCDTILIKRGRPGGDYDAGHFRSVGSAKHLEFVENNIHGQCKHCNHHLKGNQLEYQRRLVQRMGQPFVDALLNDNSARKLTIDQIKDMTVHYNAMTRHVSKERASND